MMYLLYRRFDSEGGIADFAIETQVPSFEIWIILRNIVDYLLVVNRFYTAICIPTVSLFSMSKNEHSRAAICTQRYLMEDEVDY